MAFYASDRKFTDTIHQEVALKEIYPQLGWSVFPMDPDELDKIDMEKGIDYVMQDKSGNKINVQERFREYHYHFYKDATLRYRRDHSDDEDQVESEFYKIEADYLVYGIINGSKAQVRNKAKEFSFVKYVVIDLKVLFEQIKKKKIVLDTSIGKPQIIDGVMHACVNENKDYSSSFVAFDVKGLNDLFGKDGIILVQNGFY